eukprot:357166-Chlamydomonas_euryale.AAC.5
MWASQQIVVHDVVSELEERESSVSPKRRTSSSIVRLEKCTVIMGGWRRSVLCRFCHSGVGERESRTPAIMAAPCHGGGYHARPHKRADRGMQTQAATLLARLSSPSADRNALRGASSRPPQCPPRRRLRVTAPASERGEGSECCRGRLLRVPRPWPCSSLTPHRVSCQRATQRRSQVTPRPAPDKPTAAARPPALAAAVRRADASAASRACLHNTQARGSSRAVHSVDAAAVLPDGRGTHAGRVPAEGA